MNTVLIDEILKKLIESKATPACNLAIIYQDQITKKSVGNKQVEPEILKNDINTIFDLASLSKVIATATAILKLIEIGKVTLETKVKAILTDFYYDDVSVLNLINHTSGFVSDIKGYREKSDDEFYACVYHPERINPINTEVIYSDINFILLGLIIDKITGSLKNYVENDILKPLMMKDSAYGLKNNALDRVASYEITSDRGLVKGVVHDGKCFKMHGVSGHAGIFSPIDDVIEFARMILNNGMVNNKIFLNERSINKLFETTTEGLNENRSLAWVLNDKNYPLGKYASSKTIFHTGFSGGSILIDQTNKLAIILLANRVHPSRDNKILLGMRKEVHETIYKAIGLGNEE